MRYFTQAKTRFTKILTSLAYDSRFIGAFAVVAFYTNNLD